MGLINDIDIQKDNLYSLASRDNNDNDNINNKNYLKHFLKLYQDNNKKNINISNKELYKFIEYLINNNILILKELEIVNNKYEKISYAFYNFEKLTYKLNTNLNILINIIILFAIFNLILLFSIYIFMIQ